MKSKMILVAAALVLNGCATPAGRLSDADFAWSRETIPANYQAVYRNIVAGFRGCQEGVPDGNLFTDIETAHFDVYAPGVFGERTPVVWGVIDIVPAAGGAEIKTGVRPWFDAGGRRGRMWLAWARGGRSCNL